MINATYCRTSLTPIAIRARRGLSSRASGQRSPAEFQKILDHRGIVVNEPIGDRSSRPCPRITQRKAGFRPGKVDDDGEEEAVDNAIEATFTIERDLELALCSNIEQLEPGLKITDTQTIVPSGRIDIAAVDKNGSTVVIELKAGEADRNAIGQLLAYMGDLQHEGKTIRGILVAGDFDPRS